MREFVFNFLSVAVLVSLLGTLMFATGALKAKKDPAEKKKQGGRALVFLGLYAVFNILRLLMENGVL